MKVKIYQPARSATQSGKARKKWIIKICEDKNIRHLDQLMKWTSVENTLSELDFEFNSKEDAINFAKEKNFDYTIIEPQKPTLKKKSYAENFI